jgi:hypothetical protein
MVGRRTNPDGKHGLRSQKRSKLYRRRTEGIWYDIAMKPELGGFLEQSRQCMKRLNS